MLTQSNQTIAIALCTAVALIAFAWNQAHSASVHVWEVTLFLVAAIICVSPGAYRLVRHKNCRASNAG